MNEPSTDYLQSLLDAMPPVRAMAVRVVSAGPDRVRLFAPLECNVNDKGCAFGGSISGLMTLAAWGLAMQRLHALGMKGEVYVAEQQIRYLAPLHTDLLVEAWLADPDAWEPALARVRERGRSRLELEAQLLGPDGPPTATMNARFALLVPAP